MEHQQKTVPTGANVEAFIQAITEPRRREEAARLVDLLARASGELPVLWGASIVGFGAYSYRYGSGRSGSSFLTGFSPRKAAFTIYIMTGLEAWPDLMARIGKVTTGKSCLYVRKLADIDESVLEEITRKSVRRMRELHPD